MYTDCNPKTMELRDCVLIRACAVIRSNTVCLIVGFVVRWLKNQFCFGWKSASAGAMNVIHHGSESTQQAGA